MPEISFSYPVIMRTNPIIIRTTAIPQLESKFGNLFTSCLLSHNAPDIGANSVKRSNGSLVSAGPPGHRDICLGLARLGSFFFCYLDCAGISALFDQRPF